jgi:YVTN family beta-propeller protein
MAALFAFLLIGILPLMVSAQTADESLQNNRFETYEDDKGIKLIYPQNWERKVEEDRVTFIPPAETTESGKNLVNFSIHVDTIDERVDLEGYVDEKDRESELENSNLTDLEFLKSDHLIIKGYDVYRLEFRAKDGGQDIRSIENMLLKGDKAFSIRYFAESSRYHKYLPTIQNMINSFIDAVSEPDPIELAGISLGGNPIDLAVDPNTNLIYVADSSSNRVIVIDGYTDKIVTTIDLDEEPKAIAINPHNNTVYVANAFPNSTVATIIDAKTNRVMSNIPSNEEFNFDNVEDIAVNQKGTVYLADPNNGTISAIDTELEEDEAEYERYEIHTTYLGDSHSIRGIATNININTESDLAFAISEFELTDSEEDGGAVSLIDGEMEEEIARINVGLSPNDIAINPYTDMLYVTDRKLGMIFVIDGSTLQQVANITVGTGVEDIVVNPNTNTLYVTNSILHEVSVIDEVTNRLIAVIPVGKVNTGGTDLSEDAISINPNTNMVYVTNDESSRLYVINGSTNKLVAGLNYTVFPQNAGEIYCNGIKVSNTYHRFEVGNTNCEAKPNRGFVFNLWSGDMPSSSVFSSTTFNSNNPADNPNNVLPFSSLLEETAPNSNSYNNRINFQLGHYGNLTAAFKEAPPPFQFTIPPQTLFEIFILSISAIVTLFIPSMIRWSISKRQLRHLDKYMTRIFSIYDGEFNKRDECLQNLERTRREIDESFAKGKVSEAHYQILNKKISEFEDRIKSKQI